MLLEQIKIHATMTCLCHYANIMTHATMTRPCHYTDIMTQLCHLDTPKVRVMLLRRYNTATSYRIVSQDSLLRMSYPLSACFAS